MLAFSCRLGTLCVVTAVCKVINDLAKDSETLVDGACLFKPLAFCTSVFGSLATGEIDNMEARGLD